MGVGVYRRANCGVGGSLWAHRWVLIGRVVVTMKTVRPALRIAALRAGMTALYGYPARLLSGNIAERRAKCNPFNVRDYGRGAVAFGIELLLRRQAIGKIKGM